MSVMVPSKNTGASAGLVGPCSNCLTGVPGARAEAAGAVGVPTGAPGAEEATGGAALAATGVPAGFQKAVYLAPPAGTGAGASRKSGDVPSAEPSLLLPGC